MLVPPCAIVAELFSRQACMSTAIKFPAEAVAAKVRGERLLAIKLVREANPGMDLREAMEAVDAYALGQEHFFTGTRAQAEIAQSLQLPDAAIAAIAHGRLIEAIKIVREATGLGLKEAKDLVDQHREGPPASVSLPRHKSPEQAGRGNGSVVGSTRTTSTISTETRRHGVWWMLGLIGCFAAAWFWLGR